MSAARVLAGHPQLLDEMGMARTLMRLGHEIADRHAADEVVLAGVRTRGLPLAARLQRALLALGLRAPRVLALDLREYRDDRPRSLGSPATAVTALDGGNTSVEGALVVLVDDVIYTGRTFRAALDALVDAGRPSAVELLVLVDRGHRELPLRPTYVGKNVPTSVRDHVAVRVREIDGFDGAWIVAS